jgi:hypothetical protein
MRGKSIIVTIAIAVCLALVMPAPKILSANVVEEIKGAPPIISNFNETGPLLSGDHNNDWLMITCDVDDTTQEGSNILSAEISIDGGPWLPMDPVIPPFDDPFETVTINWTAPPGYYATGAHNYVVRATDADGGTNLGVADSFTIVDTTTPSGAWLTIPGATWEIGTPCSFISSYEDFTAYNTNISNSYFEYSINAGTWSQFAWINDSFAWGSYTNILNYTMATGGFVNGDVMEYRGFIDDTGGGAPVQLTQGTVTLIEKPIGPDPYPIYGRVKLYDGTSAGGYAPLLAGAGAPVQVTWWNIICDEWSLISTVTNAAGQYMVDLVNYSFGGVVFVNATFNAPYNNHGHNYSFIDYPPFAVHVDVICGFPYDVVLNEPADSSELEIGVPFDVEYKIVDIDGMRAKGYFTFADGPINLSASGSYAAPLDQYFNGTTSPDPGHYFGSMTMYTSGNNQWVNVSEGGYLENNSYLTPFGEFDIDPWMTPGYLKDWNETTVNVESTFEMQLNEGWNLISIPLEQNDESIYQALSSIGGKWDCIQVYDVINDTWLSNLTSRPDSLNILKSLNHKIGFWINITEPNVTLSVSGLLQASTSIDLYAGWNLVGYPSLTDETVANALWGTGADQVMVCNPAEPYRIRDVGSTYLMSPGEGYWVHVPADSVWIVNW